MTIAFVGLGGMGSAMAGNLLAAGHDLVVWNRSPGKADPLVAKGAREAASLAEAARDASVVFSMVANDEALFTVLDGENGLLAGMKRGALHVSQSTIAVASADKIAALHAERGQRYLAAPVFGRPEAAVAAKLFVVAAGAAPDLDEAEPYLAAMGQKTFRIGDKPSAANLVKLCGNFAIMATIETMAEAMALAEKGGVPKAALFEVLTGTLFGSPIYQTYGRILVEERFTPPGFRAALGLKDMRLAGEAAEALRVPLPLLSLLRDHLVETIAKEGEEIDWSGVGRTVAKNAGL